jgi:hypothetical protein
VPELFELVNEPPGDPFGIWAALVVVGAEVGESLAGGEDVPGDVEEAAGRRREPR